MNLFLLAILKIDGRVPIIKPIKLKFACIGNFENKKFKLLAKSKTPIMPPIKIGSKNLKFFLKSVKIP